MLHELRYNKSTQRAQTFLAMQLIIPILSGFLIWRVSMVISRSSQKLNQLFLNISSKSAPKLLSNGWISDWAVSMVIQTTTKI